MEQDWTEVEAKDMIDRRGVELGWREMEQDWTEVEAKDMIDERGLEKASPQQGDLRLLSPPPGPGGGARTRVREVPADLGGWEGGGRDSLTTGPPTPLFPKKTQKSIRIRNRNKIQDLNEERCKSESGEAKYKALNNNSNKKPQKKPR
ncbi:hypothetical protein PoB_006190600 [Plakobranchus ocellatus]|uniref:Uncharacterized protein n=1 Tax=Plakobranchus ocellatus TaxID=259542 RepID=A0AAV4CUN9_9GAST|nr:hypothetical protein PoB_006190600 [Plakobranchus ocellatus]